MTTFLMSKLASREWTGSDAFNDNQLMNPQISTYDRVSQVGHAAAGRRVLRVLVVDDEQDTTHGLVRLVCRLGHAVQTAHHGFTALRVAALRQPELVLLDLDTPLMDGCQVARQLRFDFPRDECFIIAVTAQVDDERRQQCLEAGIDLLLIKPLDPSVVETLLLLECMRANRRRTPPTYNNRRSFYESGEMSC